MANRFGFKDLGIGIGLRTVHYPHILSKRPKIDWFEEPCPPESFNALKQVREKVSAPISWGERGHTKWDFVPILENKLADYIMPDMTWTGGITELKKISALCEAYYIPVSPHDAHSTTPVLINIKAIDFDIRRDGLGQGSERWMEAEGGRDQIDEGRFVADLTFTKQAGGADVAAAAMRFDAAPVVNSLKDVFAIFVDL